MNLLLVVDVYYVEHNFGHGDVVWEEPAAVDVEIDAFTLLEDLVFVLSLKVLDVRSVIERFFPGFAASASLTLFLGFLFLVLDLLLLRPGPLAGLALHVDQRVLKVEGSAVQSLLKVDVLD